MCCSVLLHLQTAQKLKTASKPLLSITGTLQVSFPTGKIVSSVHVLVSHTRPRPCKLPRISNGFFTNSSAIPVPVPLFPLTRLQTSHSPFKAQLGVTFPVKATLWIQSTGGHYLPDFLDSHRAVLRSRYLVGFCVYVPCIIPQWDDKQGSGTMFIFMPCSAQHFARPIPGTQYICAEIRHWGGKHTGIYSEEWSGECLGNPKEREKGVGEMSVSASSHSFRE